VSDVVHVDPARGEIRRDECGDRPAPERLENAFALALPDVAVERSRRTAESLERLHELVGPMLRTAEHQGPLDALPAEELVQRAHLVRLVHVDPCVIDRVERWLLWAHGDADGVRRVALRDRAHLGG